jgi:hypothetical protein
MTIYIRKNKEHILLGKPFYFYNTLVKLAEEAGVSWRLEGDDLYENITWGNEGTPPTKEVFMAEVNALNAQWQATEYQRLRMVEYPDITDYIDGVVKGNQTQIDAYIAACQAVKDKYPKP